MFTVDGTNVETIETKLKLILKLTKHAPSHMLGEVL